MTTSDGYRSALIDLGQLLERAWLGPDDALDRYEMATDAAQSLDALVSRMTDLRARALAELHVDGHSYAVLAAETGITRSRAQQLVERGREVVPPKR